MAQACDIAIIGAGAVGLASAIAAADSGFSVTLIGPTPLTDDGRTVALLGLSWRMLEHWGVAAALHASAAPLSIMRLVDDTGSLFRQPPVEFKAAEIGLDAFGWNVETTVLVKALAEAVKTRSAIRHLTGTVSAITPDGSGRMVVAHEKGPLVTAGLVIGADGRNSFTRRAAGIATRAWSYPQGALTTILTHARDHRDASTEFHTRSGPCTLVPLPGRRSSLVWMTSPEEGQRLMELDDAALARAVETRCHSMLGAMALAGPRGLVPMGGLSVERLACPGIALVGEAAHVFPPIGAQGLNLGLRDVSALMQALTIARDEGEPLGSLRTMERYNDRHRTDVTTRTGAVDMLNRSLLADFLPMDLGRGAGLLALANIGPLRRFIMRQGLSPGLGARAHASG